MNKTFPSHIALPEETKTSLVHTLNGALAMAIDLYLQVKQAHWNIKGPQFFARHQLFDELADKLRLAADAYAERASTLGGYAEGTLRLAAGRSDLPEYDLRAVDGRAHIQTLVQRYHSYTEYLRRAIDQSEERRDPATADLFTEALREAELGTWFLESHLHV
jgi:starvation-inducible DNA-binding protein